MDKLKLKDLVSNYLHRKDMTSELDYFVDFATTRIGAELKCAENEVNTTYQMTANPGALPNNFGNIRSLRYVVSSGTISLRSTNSQMMARHSKAILPQFYIVRGKTLETAGTSLNTDFYIDYFAEPDHLANDTDTNAVLTKYPHLYLYACLMEGFFFVQDNDGQERAEAQYLKELRRINNFADTQRAGGVPAMAS